MTKLLPLLLSIAALALVSCAIPDKPSSSTARDLSHNLTYFEDRPRKLCFAAMESMSYSGYAIVTIANVPCSAEVLAAIGEEK